MNFKFKEIFKSFQQTDPLLRTQSISRVSHLFFGIASFGLVAFLVWCSYGTLDIVSKATGRVMPSSRIKSVQHLEGGIVKEILVKEGDQVEAGEPLLYLEKIWQGASSDELYAKTVALQMDVARLQAELEGKSEVKFPQELEQQQPLLAKRIKELMKARLQAYRSKLSAQKEKIIQRQKAIDGIKAKVINEGATLKLLQKQIAISEGLMKEKLMSEYNHLSLLKEASQKRGGIENGKTMLQSARSSLKEAEAILTEITDRFRESAQRELKETGQMFEELSKRQLKMDDSLARTIVRAPESGIIKTLYIVTQGGIVQPGMVIMDIVPEADQLIIQAKLPVADVGYVRKGQRAVLRLASSDARRLGSIDGEVSLISPDTFVAENGNTFYTVHIIPEEKFFMKGRSRYELYPGVLVDVSFHTGQRTIMEYLLDPFLNAVDTSMQER